MKDSERYKQKRRKTALNRSAVKVNRQQIAVCPDGSDMRAYWYGGADSDCLFEQRSVSRESDFSNEEWVRESADNGKTWSDWKDVYSQTFEAVGEADELLRLQWEPMLYDPASGNSVTCAMIWVLLGFSV